MRIFPVLSMLALSATAFAANPPAAPAPNPPANPAPNRVMATKVDGVTLDQLKAAQMPIAIAKYDADGAHMSVRCAGATGQLSCEVWNVDTNKAVAMSNDLKLCKDGNDYAIMGDKAGPGKMIVIPTGMFIGDPAHTAVCGG